MPIEMLAQTSGVTVVLVAATIVVICMVAMIWLLRDIHQAHRDERSAWREDTTASANANAVKMEAALDRLSAAITQSPGVIIGTQTITDSQNQQNTDNSYTRKAERNVRAGNSVQQVDANGNVKIIPPHGV